MGKMTTEIAQTQKEFAVAAATVTKSIAELKAEYAKVSTGLPTTNAAIEKLTAKILESHRNLKATLEGTQALIDWLPFAAKQWEELLPLARDAEKTLDDMTRESKEKQAYFKSRGDDRKVKLEAELWTKAFQKAQRDVGYYKGSFDSLEATCREPLKSADTLALFNADAMRLGRHLAKLEPLVKEMERSLVYEARGKIKQPTRYLVKPA